MDMAYIVKGKLNGERWKSEIYSDAQDMSDKYHECLNNNKYTEIKTFNVYIHYEEMTQES